MILSPFPIRRRRPVSGEAPAPAIEVGESDLDAVQGGAVAPRDPASGLATGRRQHKPFTS